MLQTSHCDKIKHIKTKNIYMKKSSIEKRCVNYGSCDYLPGRRRAESSKSGRLVAPMTNTSQDLTSPSSSASSWETTLQTVYSKVMVIQQEICSLHGTAY